MFQDPVSMYNVLKAVHVTSSLTVLSRTAYSPTLSVAVTELSHELDPTMTDHANIPIISNHYAPHACEEMAEAMEEDYPVWKQNTDIDKFREKFGFSSANARNQKSIDDLASLSTGVGTPEGCQRFLSAVGNLVQGVANDPERRKGPQKDVAIRFRAQGGQSLRNPPEGTRCRPGIVTFDQNRLIVSRDELPVSASTRNNKQDYVNEDGLTWAQVEATAEYLSAQDTPETSLAKAITYTCYHLLSRPDRVIVPGFYFGPSSFSLIFTGASGVCRTELKWKNRDHLQLLCDFVERIFNPSPEMVDPNIVRNTDDTFDVTLKTKTYPRCKIMSLGRAIGRRTTIFTTGDPDVPIIKEQYLISQSPEPEFLKCAHGVPGVVRLHDYQEYRTGDSVVGCTIGGKPRYKIRLALKDKGVSIKESETPELFLTRLYDMLETAECLYRMGVLHRDYSLNNVLFREPTVTEEKHDPTFCSAMHLLDPSEDRLVTEMLLIDFEHAANCEKQSPLESAGTPLYQARAAQQLAPMKFSPILVQGMPDLTPEARERYQKIWPERWNQFPPDDKYHIFESKPEDTKKWYHELRHDVESTFWMLLHWAILLRPNGNEKPTRIPPLFWGTLIDPESRRLLVLEVKEQETGSWLDPSYMPLRGLLRDMAKHLEGDLHWVSMEEGHPAQMAEASYLREVFQRCILNFLFKNKGQPFMRQKKHRVNRLVEKSVHKSSDLSIPQIDTRQLPGSSTLKRLRDEEDQLDKVKRRKNNPNPESDSDYEPGR